jgi:hypothetical protein
MTGTAPRCRNNIFDKYGVFSRHETRQVWFSERAAHGVHLIDIENRDKICSVGEAEESWTLALLTPLFGWEYHRSVNSESQVRAQMGLALRRVK